MGRFDGVDLDDVELGSGGSSEGHCEDAPLRAGVEGRQLSDTAPRSWQAGQPSVEGSPAATGRSTPRARRGAVAASGDSFRVTTTPQFIDFDLAQRQSSQLVVDGKLKARGSSVVSLVATSATSDGTWGLAASPPLVGAAGGSIRLRTDDADRRTLEFSEAGPTADPGADMAAAGGAAAQQLQQQPQQSPTAALAALARIAAPVSVPIYSVLFSVASSILAITFFVLFLAHHDQWEETGCTLLLTAASATAGPATLTLGAVRNPATLVCLGKEHHGPLVTEDSLQALLAAHPKAFGDVQAQLSFTATATTPTGGGMDGGSPAALQQRWGISLEVEGLAFDASSGTATIQVEDWEAAAAADAGTIYPGTEAFEAQFGAGAPLGQPLLVFRLDEGIAEGLVRS